MNHIPITYHIIDADGDRGEQFFDTYYLPENSVDTIRDHVKDYIKHINPDADEFRFAYYFNSDWHQFHYVQ